MIFSKEKWKKVKLGEVCEKVAKVELNSKEGLFNYIDIGSIDSKAKRVSEMQIIEWKNASSRARQIVKRDDILFSTVRVNLEKIAYIDYELTNGIASTGFTVIRASQLVNPRFLFYSVISPIFVRKLVSKQKGTAYPAVTDKIVFDEEILVPPIEEQHFISSLFHSLEKSIELVENQSKLLHSTLHFLINEHLKESSSFRKGLLHKLNFGSMANNISEHINPQDVKGQIFVGLDDIDSSEIRIKRFGVTDNLIGTKLKVYKGDIIFGKRNAYLRKACVSTFDGICSAHSMVIRAKEECTLNEYLPFFMHSDNFMSRAKEISEGSISPTIKWKNLEKQVFLIPTLVDQKKIASIFIKFEEVRELLDNYKSYLYNLKEKLFYDVFS